MGIQWYPGHMTKARRELAEWLPAQDVIIEVLDARMVAASMNPVVRELRGDKPVVLVLSKSDLADPVVTKAWMAALNARKNTIASSVTSRSVMMTSLPWNHAGANGFSMA